MYGKLPTLPKSLFFCSVSSLSATLSFGLWASFRLTTIFFCFCTRPIADVHLNRIPFFVSFVLFVVNSLRSCFATGIHPVRTEIRSRYPLETARSQKRVFMLHSLP